MAAGSLLVTEAGGRISGYRNAPYNLFGTGVVATNGHLHNAMLEIIG
jgi:myo-inositol-1(or 4)-monophosphatase